MIYLLLLRCLSHRPLRHRALLPIALPIAPSCAAAHHIACHAAVGCCPSCRPSCRRAMLPVALPVMPLCAAAHGVAVAPQCAAACGVACRACYDHGSGLPRTIFFSYLIYLPFT